MVFLYSIGIRLYGFAVRIASLFSAKAAKWISGRVDWQSDLKKHIATDSIWVWVHAASLGEFEQGRPLIERIKRELPHVSILLTFFSPSGYDVRKNYPHADYVSYMPLDTRQNAQKFVQAVNPSLAIFIKYEIWYHHLSMLRHAGIPTILISAQFRQSQFYFGAFGKFFLPLLRNLKQIFAADGSSYRVLKANNFENARVSGDTRIDRVIETSQTHRDFSFLKDVLKSDDVFVLGSTWPQDEAIATPLINRLKLKAVIAPHEINEAHLLKIEENLSGVCCRLSRISECTTADVIIVDTIGDLAHIYHIASMAYIGGGFGNGIHNILEAAVYGIPVFFGPKHRQFAEAIDLIQIKAAFPVAGTQGLEDGISAVSDSSFKKEIAEALQTYFHQHEGASALIYDYICSERLL